MPSDAIYLEFTFLHTFPVPSLRTLLRLKIMPDGQTIVGICWCLPDFETVGLPQNPMKANY